MIGVLSNRVHLGPSIVYGAYFAGIGNILFVMGSIAGIGGIAGTGGFLGAIAFITWALRYRSSLMSQETPHSAASAAQARVR